MGAASGPISAVSSVISVGAGLVGAGYQADAVRAKAAGENAADQAQADRLDRAAQYGKAAAEETNAQLSENLNVQLGNIDAVRAAAHSDPSSPAGQALRDRAEYMGDRAKAIQVGNITAKAAQDKADADYMRQAGAYALKVGGIGANAAMLGGVAGAAGTVAKTDFSKFRFG